jgi:carbonic anhydrase/acetyltransferase-like protein (isoleucine patch superfamily)
MTGLYELDGITPVCADDTWIAPGACVMGNVVLEAKTSVWFNAVIRGDNEQILIGEGTNIQDLAMLHTDISFPMSLGPNCTIGHSAILHGCTIGANSLIGMGATVLNGAQIGENCLIGANALVTEGKVIPDGSLVMGSPAKVVKALNPDAFAGLAGSALGYQANAARFRAGLRPVKRG